MIFPAAQSKGLPNQITSNRTLTGHRSTWNTHTHTTSTHRHTHAHTHTRTHTHTHTHTHKTRTHARTHTQTIIYIIKWSRTSEERLNKADRNPTGLYNHNPNSSCRGDPSHPHLLLSNDACLLASVLDEEASAVPAPGSHRGNVSSPS